MLKFVSLSAKSGRREIARQTIRKILPKIADWNYKDESYFNNSLDLKEMRTTELMAVYKYVKHIVIPELEEQQGLQAVFQKYGISRIRFPKNSAYPRRGYANFFWGKFFFSEIKYK